MNQLIQASEGDFDDCVCSYVSAPALQGQVLLSILPQNSAGGQVG
jgi:hypothetical protein